MAVLPTADALGENLPSPQPSGAVAAYQPPNWRQTGLAGEIVSQGGREIQQAAQTMIQANAQQGQLLAQGAANQLENTRVQQQFDANTGWANAKQGAAVGPDFIQSNTQKFQDAQQQIRDTLPDEYSKKVYDEHAAVQFSRFQGSILSHQAQETDKFNSTVENSTIQNALAAMTRDPSNELEFQHDLATINGTVDAAVARRGLPASEADTLKRQYMVAAYTSRINSIQKGVPGGAPADPLTAQHMLTQVWDQLGEAGPKLWDSVSKSVNSLGAKSEGTNAYNAALGTMVQPTAPKSLGAPYVQPLSPDRITQIANFVKSPTPWDKDILAAAQANNVNPAEIKLKIAMESGGNPNAVNPLGGHGDHATGLGQFTADTAARYGVTDRTDPVQSINGIARMLAANGGTAGNDMSKADRAYYGGNVNAQGPNTDQYVENTRAARQAAIGQLGQTQITSAQLQGLEGTVIQNAEARAQAQWPNDPAQRDRVVQEAHRNWSVALASARGQEYSDFTNVLNGARQAGAQAPSDLPQDAQATYNNLTPQLQASIDATFKHNQAASRGELTHSDPKLFNDTLQKITLPDGDPNKITSPSQIAPLIAHGINLSDAEKLKKAVTDFNDPENSPFVKKLNGAKDTGRKMLVGSLAAMSPVAMAHPDFADEAAYRFGVDLDNRVAAMRTAGKDPRTLFDPSSPDYALAPARVASFMPTEAQITAQMANKPAVATAAPSAPQMTFASPAEANAAFAAGKLKPGTRVVVGGKTGTWQ